MHMHRPLVLSVFKPSFYTVLWYVSTGSKYYCFVTVQLQCQVFTVPWHNFSFCKMFFFLLFVFYIIFILHVLLHLRLKRYVFYIEYVLCYIIILLCCKCKFPRGPIWLVKLNKYKYINVYMFRHDSNCQLDGLYVYSLCISASCVLSKQCYPGVRLVWQRIDLKL